jgi:hypothetical protein
VSLSLCTRTKLMIGTEAQSELSCPPWFGLFTPALSSLKGMSTFHAYGIS